MTANDATKLDQDAAGDRHGAAKLLELLARRTLANPFTHACLLTTWVA
jgi:hypothetical protein